MNPKDDLPPMDDSGINNDYILDICDFIIKTAWKKYVGDNKNFPPSDISVEELKDLAFTVSGVWSLAQDIIDLDRRLRDFYGDDDLDNLMNEDPDGY